MKVWKFSLASASPLSDSISDFNFQGIHLIQLQLLGAPLTLEGEGVLHRTQVHPREVVSHTQVRAGLLLMRRLLPEEPQLTGHQWEVLLSIQVTQIIS